MTKKRTVSSGLWSGSTGQHTNTNTKHNTYYKNRRRIIPAVFGYCLLFVVLVLSKEFWVGGCGTLVSSANGTVNRPDQPMRQQLHNTNLNYEYTTLQRSSRRIVTTVSPTQQQSIADSDWECAIQLHRLTNERTNPFIDSQCRPRNLPIQ